MKLLIKKLSEEAIMPEKAFPSDAGFDLFSHTHIKLFPGERGLLHTDIAVKLPNQTCGIIKDRSGNAFKRGLHVLAGIIDESYTGEICVCIINLSKDKQIINIGDKIAQMLVVPVPVIELEEVDKLPKTDRGSGGFGSTGN